MDSGSVSAPQPTAAETALTQEQTQLLRDQRTQMQEQLRMQNLLAPILYKSAGISPVFSRSVDSDPRLIAQITGLEQQMDAIRAKYAPQLNAIPSANPLDRGVSTLQRNRIFDQMQAELAPLQAQLDPLRQRQASFASGNQIVGFQDLPETPEEMRRRQMEELSFQRAQSAFEMEQARFAQEKADLPALAEQRALETAFRKRTLADLEEQAAARGANAEVEGLLRQRTLAALKGELPVNPALMRELGTGEEELRASLFKQLGSGFETSTPGIQALAEFNQRKSEILEGARRGDLQLGEQLNFARDASRSQRMTEALPILASRLNPTGANFDAINQGYAGVNLGMGARQQQLLNMLIPQQTTAPITAGLSNVIAGFNSPISSMQNNRQQQFAAMIQNQNAQSQENAGYGALFGTALMAVAV